MDSFPFEAIKEEWIISRKWLRRLQKYYCCTIFTGRSEELSPCNCDRLFDDFWNFLDCNYVMHSVWVNIFEKRK